MTNRLTLRATNSNFPTPFEDVVKGSVLSWDDLDNNQIYLKGEIIYTAQTSGSTITLRKINGNSFSFDVSSLSSDIYITGGTFNNNTGTLSLVNNSGNTINISGFTGTTTYWSAGTGVNAIVLKNSNSHSSGRSSVSIGSGSTAFGNYSFAEGIRNIASGVTSHAEGSGTTALGDFSHSEGYGNIASGKGSHVEGGYDGDFFVFGNTASTQSAHAEGIGTKAIGNYASHAEGYTTIASGDTSHAEGFNTIAGGVQSHAEGQETIAEGLNSHAEGYLTQATNTAAHAEGQQTVASGASSHAEGAVTNAFGENSHAEGSQTTASGNQSHSEGQQTTSSGDNSHAEGFSNSATKFSSHVQGSGNTASGIVSHVGGANNTSSAFASAIIAGNGNVLTSGATNSSILGGKNITGSTADTSYVSNFNINSTPNTGSGSDNVLVRSSDGSVKSVTQSSLAGSGVFFTKIAYFNDLNVANSGVTNLTYYSGITAFNSVGTFLTMELNQNDSYSGLTMPAVNARFNFTITSAGSSGNTLAVVDTFYGTVGSYTVNSGDTPTIVASGITSSINMSNGYSASSVNSAVTMTMTANTGSVGNGFILNLNTTGGLTTSPVSGVTSGGADETSTNLKLALGAFDVFTNLEGYIQDLIYTGNTRQTAIAGAFPKSGNYVINVAVPTAATYRVTFNVYGIKLG